MKRTYLTEDIDLIQRHFPGAKAVTLRTPFDLTQRAVQSPRLRSDSFHDIASTHEGWFRDALWTN